MYSFVKISQIMLFSEKHPGDLTAKEISQIHLDTSFRNYQLKDCVSRSMLSFTMEGVNKAITTPRTRNVLPVISLLCVLEQLGTCYDSTEKTQPTFTNGIKRALYFFGDLPENSQLIKVLYALRNGLAHHVSLCSKNPYVPTENYYFRYNKDITEVSQPANIAWDGNYSSLNLKDNVTMINIDLLRTLVTECIFKARKLNDFNQLTIKLNEGLMELFYCYLRSVPNELIELGVI